jgi:DNA-binding CsgD family transcriptional regulator
LDIVEAAYRIDLPDDEWLRCLAGAVRPYLDEGFGFSAFEFHRPEGAVPRILQQCRLGMPDKLAEVYPLAFQSIDPEMRQRPFRMGPCVTGSELTGLHARFHDEPNMKRYLQPFGLFDTLWITAAEPTGYGCGFHAGRAKIGSATPTQVRRWGRIAAHLSASVRLRRRLRTAEGAASSAPEAVLDGSGAIHDVSGAATTAAARALLKRAVVMFETARGSQRKTDPDKSLADWKGLVAGRWSLLEHYDHDGRRYIVARQNEPEVFGSSQLTKRERQVLEYARLGHHNKLIAYDLGIADSTVRVLLARAAAKLGVRTRDALLRATEPASRSAG